MTLYFLNHASVLFDLQEGQLLIDPWFKGSVFNESWALIVENETAPVDYSRLRWIWISHEHPDHLHFPTLKHLREQVSGPLTVFYREEQKNNVKPVLEKMGFEVVLLKPLQSYPLTPTVTLESIPVGTDTAMVVSANDRVYLNQNDCKLSLRELSYIKTKYGTIDYWLNQFSLAGFSGRQTQAQEIQEAREELLDSIAFCFNALSPECFIPFASYVYFCRDRNAYLNEYVITPHEILERFKNLPIALPIPGMKIEAPLSPEENQIHAQFWKTLEQNRLPSIALPSVSKADLFSSAQKFLEELAYLPSILRPNKIEVWLEDFQESFVFNFKTLQVSLKKQPNPKAMAGQLQSADLLFFFKFPWGADTLNITGCALPLHAWRWHRLLHLKNMLYLPEQKYYWKKHLQYRLRDFSQHARKASDKVELSL